MTTSTPNLGLVLYNSTTDSAEYFSNFRAVIAGTSLSSNFYKIDTAYGSMQTEIDDIQAGAYFTLASYISANYYEATVTGVTAYNTGMKIILQLDTASAGTVTLNINSLGTKSVMKIDSSGTPANISAGELMVDKYYLFAYDGTRWVWVNSTSGDQMYISGTSGNVVTVNSDNTFLGTTTPSSLVSSSVHNATDKDTPADADEMGLIDSASSYVLKNMTFLSLKLGAYLGIKPPDGTVYNGRFVPSVSIGVLTLSLKTFSGGNPSSTDPVFVTIGGTVRKITSALSVSAATGTNWSNAGGSELATYEHDRFIYLGYNSTDGVVLGHARIPYARVYGDFSTTSTDEKYCIISNISNATSTDNYVNVGRFAITLSGGAGYSWSAPISYTSSNLIQSPIFTTDWKDFNSVPTGFSSNPPTNVYQYRIDYKTIGIVYRQVSDGTSNATSFTSSLPFAAMTKTNGLWFGFSFVTNNSVVTMGYCYVQSGGNSITFSAVGGFTASGGKRANTQLVYPIN